MAKKGMDMGNVKWFPILLLLVGLWFLAADLWGVETYNFTLLPILTVLVGLKMIFKK